VTALALRVDTPSRIFGGLWLLALVFGTATLGGGMLAQAAVYAVLFGGLCVLTALWTKPAVRYGATTTPVTFAIACAILAVVFVVTTYDGMLFWGVVHAPMPLWTPLHRAVGDLAHRLGLQRMELQNPFSDIVVAALLLLPLRLGRQAFGVGRFRPGAARTALLWLGIGILVLLYDLVVHAWTAGHLGHRILSDIVQNGYSEEFLFRGAILGVLASRIGAGGANLVQALLFAVFQTGVEMNLYHDGLVGMSRALLTTGVFGWAMGFVTLRTGNIAIPGAFHALFDAWVLF
jgi:membrane protease YdiL (CAAX protease family)